MVCRFSCIADTLLQRWSNVFLQNIGHFVTSIHSSIAKLISASTSDFHGSISPLGGGFRNLIRSASDRLRSLLGTIAHGVGHVIPLLRQNAPTSFAAFVACSAPSLTAWATLLPWSCKKAPTPAAAFPISSNGLNPIPHASFNANGQKPPLCASSAHSFFDLL